MNRLTRTITARTRRHPNIVGAIGFFGAAIGAMSIGVAFTGTADARPIPLHHPTIALTPGVCDSAGPDMWTTTLTVTADVPGGTAHILDAASGWKVPVPVSHVYHIGTNYPTWPVMVSVSWPDGFTSDTTTLVANRPTSGCVPASTVPGTTTTTTCSRAIPPRQDCGTTTIPPTTTATTVPVTTVPDVPTTAPPVSVKKAVAAPPTTGCTVNCGPTGTLPTTGAGDDALAVSGVALLGFGFVLILLGATRRNARSGS